MNVVLQEKRIFVTVTQPQVHFRLTVGSSGPQGPPGVQGPPGDVGNEVEAVAGENLSAGRVVVVSAGKVYYFQPTNTAHAGRAYGVTKHSALLNAAVVVITAGQVTDASFIFPSDTPLFAGVDGEIGPTPHPTGLVQYVGFGVASTIIHTHFLTTLIR